MEHNNSILAHFGSINATFIHANGKSGTAQLIHYLDCKPDERILEIGFGTGATLALLVSRYKATRFYGVEASGIMYARANARLQFCGLREKTVLEKMIAPAQLPFEDDCFDKVYLESVLGIQPDLRAMLAEIKRVLKPGGFLLMNETIWLESTLPDKILEINTFCEKAFGIIQSNGDFPYLKDWRHLLESMGFEINFAIALDKNTPSARNFSGSGWRSRFFTRMGKLKSLLVPRLKNAHQVFKEKIKYVNASNETWMEGYLFKACNKK